MQFRMGIPDHESAFGEQSTKYNWMETVYSCSTEEIPEDAPEPKGNLVCTSTYCNANLLHNLITGRSASGLLHFLNQTPINHFSKHQTRSSQLPMVPSSWRHDRPLNKSSTFVTCSVCSEFRLTAHCGCQGQQVGCHELNNSSLWLK